MPCRAAEHGAALVLALLVFALVASLVVASQSRFNLFYQRSANALHAEQAFAYLLGAEELAAVALDADLAIDRQRDLVRDDLTEIWAQPTIPYPLEEGGYLQGALTDLQGLFNLHNLIGEVVLPPGSAPDPEAGAATDPVAAPVRVAADGARRFLPAEQQFIRLLLAVSESAGLGFDVPQAVAVLDAVADWLDADSEPRPQGAEDSAYEVRAPAYRAANQPMHSVSELRAVAGVTPALYQALAPWVTVWPQAPAALNIHTAPLPVLRSLGGNDDLQPLPMDDAQRLERTRAERGYGSLAEFLEDPVFGDRDMTLQGPLLGESSSYFALRAQIDIAERETRLYSVLHRTGSAIVTLVRYQEPL